MKKLTMSVSFKEREAIPFSDMDKKLLTDFFMILYEWHVESELKKEQIKKVLYCLKQIS